MVSHALHVWLGFWIPFSHYATVWCSKDAVLDREAQWKHTQVTSSQMCGGGRRWTWPDVSSLTQAYSQVSPGVMCRGSEANHASSWVLHHSWSGFWHSSRFMSSWKGWVQMEKIKTVSPDLLEFFTSEPFLLCNSLWQLTLPPLSAPIPTSN